jgi:hypothetical protein
MRLEKSSRKLIRASRISIAVIALIAIGAAPAAAGGWRRPVTVSNDGVQDLLDDFPGFTSSPDGRHVALVTLREHKGIVVYPVLQSGRLGRGSYLPGSKDANYPWESSQAEQAAHGQYPDAAVNGNGLFAVAWQTLKGSGPIGNDAGTCNCAIRVGVGTAGGHFRSILLARTGDAVLGVQITSAGQVQVLWEARDHHLMLAKIDKPWRSAAQSAIGPEATAVPGPSEERETFLIEHARHPEILSERGGPILLAQEPFLAATPIELSWPAGETVGDWSLLSNGDGLTMAVIANVQQNALEVATPYGAGSTSTFHPVSPLVFGTTAHPSRCALAGDTNARGEALVAWTCYPGELGSEVLRAALLDPEGAVTAISPPDSGRFGPSGAAVAFDDAARGVIAEEGEEYASIFLGGRRFSHWRPIRHGPNDSQSTVAVGVLSNGVGLASWVEGPSEDENAPTWAGRIRLDRSEPEPSPGTPPVALATRLSALRNQRSGILSGG